jgi:hypothetical protein
MRSVDTKKQPNTSIACNTRPGPKRGFVRARFCKRVYWAVFVIVLSIKRNLFLKWKLPYTRTTFHFWLI